MFIAALSLRSSHQKLFLKKLVLKILMLLKEFRFMKVADLQKTSKTYHTVEGQLFMPRNAYV